MTAYRDHEDAAAEIARMRAHAVGTLARWEGVLEAPDKRGRYHHGGYSDTFSRRQVEQHITAARARANALGDAFDVLDHIDPERWEAMNRIATRGRDPS